MPADRPSHRTGPAPDGSSYRSDAERAHARSEVGNQQGGPAPTRAQRVYPEGREPLRGGRDSENPGVRHTLTRAERFSFEGGQGPGRRPGARDWVSEESDEEFYARQRAGINALISISNLDSVAYDRQTEGIRALISIANNVATATKSRELIVAPTGEIRKQSRLSVISRLRKDEMTLNSLYLMINTGLMAGTGFLFWIVTTHLFSGDAGVGDVGVGSALISGANIIALFALLGLNMGMNRFLPTARNRDALISSGIALVGAAGALGAIIYILLAPLIAHTLAFVINNPLLTIGFAVATGAIAVNTLTDNIFIALRKAKYTVLVDGVIGGFGKLPLLFVIAGAGAYGIFLASSIALVLASTASLFLIFIVMRVRVDLRAPLRALKPLLRFSAANYAASIINLLASLANSLILLDRLGKVATGYYFVVLQMTQIVYTAGNALEQTFLTEGSQAGADISQLKRRALRLLALFFVLSAAFMIIIGRWLLLAFGNGGAYYHHGYTVLIILVLAAGPLSLSTWFQTILRLEGKLRAIVWVTSAWAILTCIGTWVGSSFGLTGAACGWVGASLVGLLISAVATLERRSPRRLFPRRPRPSRRPSAEGLVGRRPTARIPPGHAANHEKSPVPWVMLAGARTSAVASALTRPREKHRA